MVTALVVEDDDGIIPAIEEALEARRDSYHRAKSLEEARRSFHDGDYAYVLLDLKIPAREGGAFPDMSYGVTMLKEIRQTKGKETTPVIAMTSYHSDGFGIATELHTYGINACISKPFDEKRPLMRVIDEVLARHAASTGDAMKTAPKKLTPFKDEKRVMVIEKDRATICGIEVWRETYQPHMRDILVRLSKKDGGGYVRVSGSKLMKELDRDASNPVGRPIKTFCDNASERLAEHRNLGCGRYDIIAKGGGGYHFTDWMEVRVDGEETQADDSKPAATSATASESTAADVASEERQRRILEWIDNGDRLTQKEVIERFRRERKPATIKRDLQKLRTKGEIATHAEGHYVRRKTKKRENRQ